MNSIGIRCALAASLLTAAMPVAAQQEFPLDRPVLPTTDVGQLGSVPLEAGGTRPFGFLTAFATSDMGSYRGAIETKFPYSSDGHPPDDSIKTVTDARITTWLGRAAADAKGITPQMLMAALDYNVGHKTAAEQVYEKLLNDPKTTPAQRVLVMQTAIQRLTHGSDTAWIRSQLTLARHYRTVLEELPRTGYPTLHDSLQVLDAVDNAENWLVDAIEKLGNVDSLMVEAHHKTHIAAALPWSARVDLWRTGNYMTFAGKPQGQARMDSIQATARQLVIMTAAERAMGDNPRERPEQEKDMLNRVADMWRKPIFVHPAVGIPAHAWLNTPDSLYQPTPRTRALSPGQIHVVLTGGAEEGATSYFLNHLQPKFADVGFSVITTTNGAEGDVLVEPADEVLWHQNNLENILHVKVPVSVWAGAKRPARWGGNLPEGFPLFDGPHVEYARGTAVVDAKGSVRAYCGNPAWSGWDSDDCIVRTVNYLEAEAKGSAPAPVPDDLLPLRDPGVATTGDPSTVGGLKPAPSMPTH